MNVELSTSEYPEFSAVRSSNGSIYHMKGAYDLNDQAGAMIPVNRSYTLDQNGDRHSENDYRKYRKNRLVHEDVTTESVLERGELRLAVYGKPLLFLRSETSHSWLSSFYEQNVSVSSSSRRLVDELKNCLLSSGFVGNYEIGVYGSHQANLNSVDSDLDLIAWTRPDQRGVFLELMRRAFSDNSYESTRDSGKDAEYAIHYARKFNVPALAGWYLANKRMRWVSQQGVPVSLQVLNIDYDVQPAKEIMEGINEEWNSEEAITDCHVLSAADCYNFPKVWRVEVGGKVSNVISFSWAHQGMGDDENKFGDKYLLKAARVSRLSGDFFFMQNQNHYLLPMSLL